MKRKFKLTSLLTALAIFCSISLVQAQGGPGDPGGDPGGDPDPGPGTGVPFDGGISILVAAGIAYAAKKGHERKMKGKQEQLEK